DPERVATLTEREPERARERRLLGAKRWWDRADRQRLDGACGDAQGVVDRGRDLRAPGALAAEPEPERRQGLLARQRQYRPPQLADERPEIAVRPESDAERAESDEAAAAEQGDGGRGGVEGDERDLAAELSGANHVQGRERCEIE